MSIKVDAAFPNEDTAATVVTSMTKEKVVSSTRMTTGDQYFFTLLKLHTQNTSLE